MEILFLIVEEVCVIMEEMIYGLWLDCLNVDLGKFLMMMWYEVMNCFGLDKLDLCNLLELVDVVDILKDVEFKVFYELVNLLDGCVIVLCVLNGIILICK